MPYKNKVKVYVEKTYYHLYARGVNKMDIFKDSEDYNIFKSILRKYLDPNYKLEIIQDFKKTYVTPNNVCKKVELQAFCLMPNHFHFLCFNLEKNGITLLMNRILTSYAGVFNKKYNREGPLIQGGYRAVRITTEEQLIHVSRYIHLNPYKSKLVKELIDWKHSSYKNYLYNKENKYLKLNKITIETDWKNIIKYSDIISQDEASGFIIS